VYVPAIVFPDKHRWSTIFQALWMEDPKSITEDEHTEFYRFVTGQYDKPRYTLQYKIDVPINLRALIYIPQYKPSE
jgi:TNF receptor-associated protein 1